MSIDGNEAYRAFMDKLKQSNVDEYVDLPMIAVMGDTSSGKSSLLSMISQVELPSNDKLTTRCPIMLQMRKDDMKSALVKISWKDKPEGSNIDFPAKTVDEQTWSELTRFIAEAQEHIVTTQKKEVARDIVNIEITGPYCENLTLIDLPGIVRSHGKDESASLSNDIQSLLMDYLKNSRCVILAVLPANVDFHNSQIMAEALKVDPETMRTIPVLTKPDLIDSGAEGSVRDLLLGKKTKDFEMGFHMVKGRGQEALNSNTTIEDGLSQELSFFNNTDPWCNVDDKTLFGTKNLRMKLGELQMRLIRQSFEKIVLEIKDKLDESMQARALLGEIPSELYAKRMLFQKVKDDYHKTIDEIITGRYVRNQTIENEMKPSADFLSACKQFQNSLMTSRPANISDLSVGVAVIATNGEREIKDNISFLTDKNVYLNCFIAEDKCIYGSSKNPGEVYLEGGYVYLKREDRYSSRLKAIPRDQVRRDPEWIQKLMEMNRPYQLPIFVNNEVFEKIIVDLIQEQWRDPSVELLNHTSALMKSTAEKYVKRISFIKSLPKLRQFLLLESSEIVEKLTEEAKLKLTDFVNRECTPYTQSHYLYETLSKKRTKYLKNELMAIIGTDDTDISKTAVLKIVDNVFDRNQARSMDDHMADDMQHALDAYGKVALKRFIDNIPMICVEIMRNFPKQINDTLSTVLDGKINEVVVAPPERMKKMKDYERKIKTLKKGIESIKNLY